MHEEFFSNGFEVILISTEITKRHRVKKYPEILQFVQISVELKIMNSVLLSLPHRYKRFLQAMTVAVAIIYTTLVLCESTLGYPGMQVPTLQHIVKDGTKTVNLDVTNDLPTVNVRHRMQFTEFNAFLPKTTSVSKAVLFRQGEFPDGIKSSAALALKVAVVIPSYYPQGKKTSIIILKDMFQLNSSNTELRDHQSPTLLSKFGGRKRNMEHLPKLVQFGVSTTPKASMTELDDIYITVKTTKSYHDTRLALIIKTWFQLARDQTWFFTDTDDTYYQEKTRGHLINTKCPRGHFRTALCCKMSAELDGFLESSKNWFCHFDDDNYVNIPRLVKLLDAYSPSGDWYLGKPSISSPLEINLDSKKTMKNRKVAFWFATGGAGFCLSRALALKMLPIAGSGKFITIGDNIRFPDDVTMGFIIEHLLKVPLTVVDTFHSHLEPMEAIRSDSFQEQVSFSYAHMKNQWNVMKVNGFDLKTDPKRFFSLHCFLFPYFSFCPPR